MSPPFARLAAPSGCFAAFEPGPAWAHRRSARAFAAMHVPCMCISCGCEIGHVAAAFRHARAARVKAAAVKAGTVPSMVTNNLKMDVECADLFDKFGIRHDCCRMHLASAMVWKEQY